MSGKRTKLLRAMFILALGEPPKNMKLVDSNGVFRGNEFRAYKKGYLAGRRMLQ